MLGDLMASVQPVEVKIFGTDQNRLQQLSKQVASIVENVKGTADVFDGIVIAGPSINVEPNSIKSCAIWYYSFESSNTGADSIGRKC